MPSAPPVGVIIDSTAQRCPQLDRIGRAYHPRQGRRTFLPKGGDRPSEIMKIKTVK